MRQFKITTLIDRASLSSLREEIAELKMELKQEREAVDFYAPKGEWYYWQPSRTSPTHTSKIMNDAGKVARETIEKRKDRL